MRLLAPFRALRPPPDLAPAIASPPYDVVSSSEARAMTSGNPKSFFRISRPEVDLAPDVDEHSDVVHAKGRQALDEFRRNGWLVLDDGPRFSLYRQRMGEHVQTGLVACASVDAYVRGDIKKHELTRPDKEDDRTRPSPATTGWSTRCGTSRPRRTPRSGRPSRSWTPCTSPMDITGARPRRA